jgi:cytochrome oxidase Cu insertion factor (SCO1/SenC/PrrC family)
MSLEGKRPLLWVLAVCLVSLLASYAAYIWWRPTQHMNHGELLKTRPVPETTLQELSGRKFSIESLRGKWLLLTVQPAACDARCKLKLYYMRQVRTAQNENMMRIERLWLVTGDGNPAPELVAEHPGLIVARLLDAAWLAALPVRREAAEHIYLIDPLGNLVLRYNDESEPQGMLKDLVRLLKVSRIG